MLAQQDVLLSGSVTDKGIVPAQFLCADGLSVPPSIKTSELNTLVCNVKEADVMMYDGKRRKFKKTRETMYVLYLITNRKNCHAKKTSHHIKQYL